MALLFKFEPKLSPIIDFSIADGVNAFVSASEGLLTFFAIKDSEPSHPAAKRFGGEPSFTIGAAMAQASQHLIESIR